MMDRRRHDGRHYTSHHDSRLHCLDSFLRSLSGYLAVDDLLDPRFAGFQHLLVEYDSQKTYTFGQRYENNSPGIDIRRVGKDGLSEPLDQFPLGLGVDLRIDLSREDQQDFVFVGPENASSAQPLSHKVFEVLNCGKPGDPGLKCSTPFRGGDFFEAVVQQRLAERRRTDEIYELSLAGLIDSDALV
jgi:hypothetical protein